MATEKQKTYSLHIPEGWEGLENLKKIAEQKERSIGYLIRKAIEEYIVKRENRSLRRKNDGRRSNDK